MHAGAHILCSVSSQLSSCVVTKMLVCVSCTSMFVSLHPSLLRDSGLMVEQVYIIESTHIHCSPRQPAKENKRPRPQPQFMEETDAGESEKLTEEEKRQKVMLLYICIPEKWF